MDGVCVDGVMVGKTVDGICVDGFMVGEKVDDEAEVGAPVEGFEVGAEVDTAAVGKAVPLQVRDWRHWFDGPQLKGNGQSTMPEREQSSKSKAISNTITQNTKAR